MSRALGLSGDAPIRAPAWMPVRTRGPGLVAPWECGLQVRACYGKTRWRANGVCPDNDPVRDKLPVGSAGTDGLWPL